MIHVCMPFCKYIGVWCMVASELVAAEEDVDRELLHSEYGSTSVSRTSELYFYFSYF